MTGTGCHDFLPQGHFLFCEQNNVATSKSLATSSSPHAKSPRLCFPGTNEKAGIRRLFHLCPGEDLNLHRLLY